MSVNKSNFSCSKALGSGGIKPCVAAFGGDQFKMPEQAKYMLTFFSLFYFSINLGSFISTFITPILRSDVKCFQEDDCYPLAFGVPGALMVLSISKLHVRDRDACSVIQLIFFSNFPCW